MIAKIFANTFAKSGQTMFKLLFLIVVVFMLCVFAKFGSKKMQKHRLGVFSLSKDVALYFVHWITDLAGAEPTPS